LRLKSWRQRGGESSGGFDAADTARQIAEILWDFRRVIEEGTQDERKRLIRTFVGEIRVGFYEMPGSESAVPVGSGIFSPVLWCPQRKANPPSYAAAWIARIGVGAGNGERETGSL